VFNVLRHDRSGKEMTDCKLYSEQGINKSIGYLDKVNSDRNVVYVKKSLFSKGKLFLVVLFQC